MREPYNADSLMHLPKDRRDWLEIYGATFGRRQEVLPGTCEACVFGCGPHSECCIAENKPTNA